MRSTPLNPTQLVIFQDVLTRVCGLRQWCQPVQLHQWARRYMCNPFMTLKLGIRQGLFYSWREWMDELFDLDWAARERKLNVCCGDLRWGRDCSEMYLFQDCSLPSVCLACFYLSLKPQITALLGNYFPWADFSTCTFVLEGTPYVTMIPWQVYIPCRSRCEIVNNDLLFFILLL